MGAYLMAHRPPVWAFVLVQSEIRVAFGTAKASCGHSGVQEGWRWNRRGLIRLRRGMAPSGRADPRTASFLFVMLQAVPAAYPALTMGNCVTYRMTRKGKPADAETPRAQVTPRSSHVHMYTGRMYIRTHGIFHWGATIGNAGEEVTVRCHGYILIQIWLHHLEPVSHQWYFALCVTMDGGQTGLSRLGGSV